MTFEKYKSSLLSYLDRQKTYTEQDIKDTALLSDDEKEERGLLIRNAHILSSTGAEYELSAPNNNTKLRAGDRVVVRNEQHKKKHTAEIIENGIDRISLSCKDPLDATVDYRIEVTETVLISTLISLIENIEEGTPGSVFLKILAGIEQPSEHGLGMLKHGDMELPSTMNEAQRKACIAVFNRPSLYCIQGPPGTGKTDVLANIALAFIRERKQVLILSKTHQAVNNALNKIAKIGSDAPVIKIGNALKALDLVEGVESMESLDDYFSSKKAAKKKTSPAADIIGMTLQGAFVNLGLRKKSIMPMVVLIDEAGQIPLVEAAAIGTFRCGSVVFIGDDRQMPPIYHEKLQDDPLSTSIFTSIAEKYPELKTTLTVTYRMNREITECVSRKFYEPYGISLVASDFSADRKLILKNSSDDARINEALSSRKSLIQLDVTSDTECEDMNIEEAKFAAGLVKAAYDSGVAVADMAVITPYRRQVNTIREFCRQQMTEIPLVDTVERLQGQDVDLIIASMCVSKPQYYHTNKAFLLNPNRLNVMISRAKKKVIVLASDIMDQIIP